MAEVRWTLQASEDLDSIAEFIAKDSPQYARLFVTDVFQAVELLTGYHGAKLLDPTTLE